MTILHQRRRIEGYLYQEKASAGSVSSYNGPNTYFLQLMVAQLKKWAQKYLSIRMVVAYMVDEVAL